MPVEAPNYQYPEDIPHVTGDRGNLVLAVRQDSMVPSAATSGDYTTTQTDELGRLKTTNSRFRNPAGVYYTSERFSLLQLAHLANVGFIWLVNPALNNKLLVFRRASFTPMPGSSASMNSAPRIRMERVTFIGTAAGVPLVPAQRDTTEALPSGLTLTTALGLVLVPSSVVATFVPQWSNSLGTVYPIDQLWEPPDPDIDGIVLRPGEGLVWRQQDNGSSPETRVFHIDLVWSEVLI